MDIFDRLQFLDRHLDMLKAADFPEELWPQHARAYERIAEEAHSIVLGAFDTAPHGLYAQLIVDDAREQAEKLQAPKSRFWREYELATLEDQETV